MHLEEHKLTKVEFKTVLFETYHLSSNFVDFEDLHDRYVDLHDRYVDLHDRFSLSNQFEARKKTLVKTPQPEKHA